ncbi:hypothetical protein KR093_009266 [Drosophila rubida]|uniref:Protein terminus n=1 Tax=Drosophila rubida TaxID=30044 RepID=A0AAD4K3U3_9MUSC|nr:hypothetical protein KR093_009266 [Drosophila rubida]
MFYTSRLHQSRFIFQTIRDVRTFRHQPNFNDPSIECGSCYNVVAANEPYNHHWLTSEDAQHIKMDMDHKLLLQRIHVEHIVTFMLCDETPGNRTRAFVVEAGTEAVPHLLRFLNYEATGLEVTIGFFVKVCQQNFYCESHPVKIKHFLDIDLTVDMMFTRLVEKIANYAFITFNVTLEAICIKRMKVVVQRLWNGQQQLPLQYRVKNDDRFKPAENKHSVDLSLLHESFVNYHGKRFGDFPDSLQVNLYCFRVCARTKELFAAPYLIRNEDTKNTPTFLVQTDVAGEFRGMHEVYNIRKFLRSDPIDLIFDCRDCEGHFTNRVEFVMHKEMDCGGGITMLQLDGELPEIYENCFTLPKEIFKHAWYAIGPTF